MSTDTADAVPTAEEIETPAVENNTIASDAPAAEPAPEKMETDSITEAEAENAKETTSDDKKPDEENEKIEPEKEAEKPAEEPTSKPEEKKVKDKPDLTKDPELLASAQEELKQLDIFVCGQCYDVFHFLEEFQEHKSNPDKCPKKPNLKNNLDYDGKPQIWGFTLWRSNELKSHKPVEDNDEAKQNTKSWQMYQNWCKLDQKEKEKWINAGQTVQFVSRIGSARIHEFKVKKDLDDDGEKKRIIRPLYKGDPPNKAYRTIQEYEKQEYVVEKIVGKRFNPRKKTYEYQIKWENFDSAANTWEPPTNLVHCKPMLDEFEEKIRKEKEKAKLLSSPSADSVKVKGRGRGRPPKSNIESSPGVSTEATPKKIPPKFEFDSSGRPTRTSKQKALSQVKQWCGNISDNDEGGGGGLKRPIDDVDSSDDSFEKKAKLDDYSDDSIPEEKSKTTPKPVAKTMVKQIVKPINLNNGVGKKMPQNVLIPDANGVVRINQKQLPSLSTGVYIMSKTAGIIKLDSATSKVAASGGQTIVKVAPKIGQTQIRIVKKDGTTTTTTTTNVKGSPQEKGTPKMYKPIITKVKKPEPASARTPQPKKAPEMKKKAETKPESKLATPASTSTTNDKFDESDDGLEELEFPKDLPLPEPDSPQPTDFVLDPFTGKIAGKEYPEKEEKEDGASTLENIVKLAAADITEEDLKPDPIPIVVTTVATTTTAASPIKTRIVQTTSKTTTSNAGQKTSILNKALTDSNIIQKSSPTVVQRQPKVVPRILNQNAGVRAQQSPNIQRSASANIVRRVTPAPKRFVSPTTSRQGPNVIPATAVARNVYTKTVISPQQSNITKRPSNVATYSTVKKTTPLIQQKTPQKVQQIVQKVGQQQIVYKAIPSTKSTSQASPTKKKVINMPSLNDEPTTAATPTTTAVSTTKEGTITADLSTFTMADAEKPIYITGDDGTVYQVAGQNDQGETILITTGSDGVQQCLLVTNDGNDEQMTATPIEMPTIVSNFATSSPTAQQVVASGTVAQATPTTTASTTAVAVTEPLQLKTDDASDQVVAQVVRAEPPSPGGTHKVIVMLPDGNLMVTQVSPEEYASLELE